MEKGIMVMGDFEIERRIASWHINLYRVLARKLDMPFGLLHKPNRVISQAIVKRTPHLIEVDTYDGLERRPTQIGPVFFGRSCATPYTIASNKKKPPEPSADITVDLHRPLT